MNKAQQDVVEPGSEQRGDALGALAPKTKARKFCLLLPAIESKLRDGVRHADIIRALSAQGLEFTEGTYFNYLQRYRARAATPPGRYAADRADASRAAPTSAAPLPSPEPAVKAGTRPPTFDYDPRGIPDLLK